jgi:Cu/Ag efflux protein CusF
MRSLSFLAIAVAAAMAPSAHAQQKPEVSGAVATAPGQARAVAAVKAQAVVESIDAATRTLTLKLGSGKTRTLVASEEVRNFDQIKVGDKINVRYIEAVTLELKKDGKALVGRTETASLDRSAPGQKPGGFAQREITVVADVVNVDAKAKKVTVKGEKGQLDLDIRDPEQLKLIKKGDQIQATYNEALAIDLEPVAAPAKKK